MNVGATARTYDNAGNTLSIGGTARGFVFDGSNRMTQAKQGGVTVATYAYNGKGEQVRRTPASATDTRYFVHDEAGHLLGIYDANKARVQEFIWMDDLPVGVVSGGQVYYIQPDHLGTPRAVIDPVREVAVWTWPLTGEAFGTGAPNEDPDADGTNFVLDLRFPGQRYDAASGLNYNYFRDYDAISGRYLESDPIGLFGDIATYGYAASKPLAYFDFNGLDAIYVGCAGGQGLVVCDGKGGFEARVCDSGCAAECTRAHEYQHVADFVGRAPNRCKGKRRGASPTIEADMVKPFQYFEFECRAYRAGMNCLKKMRQRKVCFTPSCEREMADFEALANRMMRDYRCNEYGW